MIENPAAVFLAACRRALVPAVGIRDAGPMLAALAELADTMTSTGELAGDALPEARRQVGAEWAFAAAVEDDMLAAYTRRAGPKAGAQIARVLATLRQATGAP